MCIRDRYSSEKFADDSATGRNIAHEVLSTDYFVDASIQEQHINDGAVLGYHILDDSVSDRILGPSSIDTEDLSTTNDIIADDRTVADSDVFEARHFEDEAVTTEKFTRDFTLDGDLIADDAVNTSEIATGAVILAHFSEDSIESEHISNFVRQFCSSTVPNM